MSLWRSLWICAVAALPLAAQEGEWDPSGEFIRPTPSRAAKPAAPKSVDQLLQGVQSAELRPYVGRMPEVLKLASAGQYRQGQQLAERYMNEVRDIAVTQPDIAARTTLSAMYGAMAAELRALSGDVSGAKRQLQDLGRLDVPDDLKALLLAGEGYADLLDYDVNGAAAAENRARRLDPNGIQPVLAGISSLYQRDPGTALRDLRLTFGKGAHPGYATLYAAAAALALDRPAEAQGFYQQSSTAAVSYLPAYYVIGGLLDAVGGNYQAAQVQFQEAARREQGRYRMGAALNSLAALAGGDPTAAAMLSRNLGAAPVNVQAIGRDVLADPRPERAKQAFSSGRWWFALRGYAPGTILAMPLASPPPAPEMPDVPETPADALPPTDEGTPADTPGEAALPEVTGPVETPVAGAAEAPAESTQAAAPGVDFYTLETQAARAYETGLDLMRQGDYARAERALASAVRMHGFAEAWLALGQARFLQGDVQGAYQAYYNAALLRGDWADAVYSLALTEDRLGRTADARLHYAAALERGLAEPLASYARRRLAGM